MLDQCEDICTNKKIKNKNNDEDCRIMPGYHHRCKMWKRKGFCEGYDGFWDEDTIKRYCGPICGKC
uniref:ShKT domain-containing protein n=1 Tax=Meloidogyne incognita TaxID=6306 RepID=A0A914P2L9_MELIC